MSATNEDPPQIKDLEKLLSETLKINVVKHEVKPLVEAEASEIVEAEITVEENGEENLLHAVGKLVSAADVETNQIGFKNEIEFYRNIAPTVKEFQQQRGMASDYFPQFYGARLSLKYGTGVIDGDAIILLENLKTAGFQNIDLKEGFDLQTAKFVLGELANLQATVLALRKTSLKVFDSKVLPYLHEPLTPNEPLDLEVILNENPDTANLVGKMKRVLAKKRFKKIREPWATITHNQLWARNVLVRPTDDGVDGVKFLNFQTQDFGSPAIDVLLFLFTSVQIPVLKYHFEKLLQNYFKAFTNALFQFRLDITAFSYESFREELKAESAYLIYRVLFTLFEAFGVIERELNNGEQNGTKLSRNPKVRFPLKLKEKVWFIAEEAYKQHWI